MQGARDPELSSSDPRTEPTEPSTFARGDQVGRYIVIDRLGQGGMGEVLSAYDPELDRRVALKLLRVSARSNRARARERMLREAQAMAKLSHPNVVGVFDAGVHDGQVFIAMEHIDGVTLARWLQAEPRTWSQIIDVMVRAGEGLAAAHRVGLVHRDFKPANVMIGADGRVRVLDFGLARRFDESATGDADLLSDASLDELDPEPPGESGALAARSVSGGAVGSLTETGMVMGTPAYMAPEQFFGGAIDARTDQFAFCVVLFRALFGVAPFPGKSFEELGRAVEAGRVAELPHAKGVPRRIRAALERGLSVSGRSRFPDMPALLAELGSGGHNGRRVGAAVALAVALGVGVVLSRGASEAPPCAELERALDGVFGPAERARIEDAFAASAAAYAEDARRGTLAALDAYASAWVTMRRDACEATRLRGDQSEALMDLRVACLDDRRHELFALTEVLAAADAKVVENAVDAAQRLPALHSCADTEGLLAAVPPPADAETAAEVAEIREALARARALALSAKYDEAAAKTRALHDRARELAYAPLVAQTAVLLGTIEERRGKPDLALSHLDEGLWAAIESGDSRAEADATIALGSVNAALKLDAGAALRHLTHARAVSTRLGDPGDLLAQIWLYTGTAHLRAREFDQAEASYRRAAELAHGRADAERVELASLSNTAAAQGMRGNYRAALRALEDARDFAVARVGPHHPQVANIYNNLGATHSRMGNASAAIEAQLRSLEIFLAAVGPGHPDVGRSYHNLGVALAAKGDDQGALDLYLLAYEVKRASLGDDAPPVAHSLNNVGDALVRLGRAAEAIPHLQTSRAIWQRQPGGPSHDVVYSLTSLAEAKLALGDAEGSVAMIREALRITEAGDTEPLVEARIRFTAAQAIWNAGANRREAVELARSARQLYDSPERDWSQELDRVDAWLAEHAPEAKR